MFALIVVFWYLDGTKDCRLHFRGEEDRALRCYVDWDYAGSSEDYKLTSGLVITIGGAFDMGSTKPKSTAQFMTDADYYAPGVGCMKLTQISLRLYDFGLPTICQVFFNLQLLIASLKNRFHHGTAVAQVATKYYPAADVARDGEIDLGYIPTAEMFADCFAKPHPKPAFFNQCAAMVMIAMELGNGLRIRIRNGLGNGVSTVGYCCGNGIGMQIHSLSMFV
jgi:hypothetical protein